MPRAPEIEGGATTADISLRHLRHFVALSDELNYRRAAERLFITQPALSTSIKQLEQQVGIALFIRSTREVQLSDAGREWLPQVRAALQGVDDATAHVLALADAHRGVLRVGYLIGTGADLLFRLIREFEASFPETTIDATEFDFSDPTAGLGEATTDVALIRPPVDLPDHRMLTLEVEHWVACLSVDHRFAQRASIRIEELLDDPIVCAPASAGLWRDYWMATESRNGREPIIGGVAPTYESETTMVSRGLGISFTTESSARLYDRPGVTYVPIAGSVPSYTALAWDPRRLGPAGRALVTLARHAKDAEASPFDSPALGYSST